MNNLQFQLEPRNSSQTRSSQPTRFLQPKCACQRPTGPDGKCARCNRDRLASNGTLIQPELKISHPTDQYEREADRLADFVMHVPDGRRPMDRQVFTQRASNLNATGQPSGDDGRLLHEGEREFFEPRFGHDFGKARIHNDSRADRFNRELNARAFTVGSHIYFSQGELEPTTYRGRLLLAHELSHVVQQRGSDANAPLSSTARMATRPLMVANSMPRTQVFRKAAGGGDKGFSDYYGDCLETMGLPKALAMIWGTPAAVLGSLKAMQVAAAALGPTATVGDLIAALALMGETGGFAALGAEVLAIISGMAAAAFIGILIGCLATAAGEWSSGGISLGEALEELVSD